MKRFVLLSSLLVLAVVFSGCSGGALGQDTAGGDGSTEVDAVVDTAPADVGGDEASVDLPPDEPLPPPFVTCTDDDDCDGTPCLESSFGKRCAELCDAELLLCDAGWSCRELADESYCFDDATPLCRPCKADDGCLNNGLDVDATCVPFADAGGFCLVECPAGGCPDGYSCKTQGGLDVCVPVNDQCGCNAASVAAGSETSCEVRTDAGVCSGVRSCGPGGLSACSAATPVFEACDGQDNNCNGLTDEGFDNLTCVVVNEAGACYGARTCIDGAWVCTATTPAAESCNGADDDCDGTVDERDASDCDTWYVDADQDGHGLEEGACLCAPTGWYTASGTDDCDDTESLSSPGHAEFCDGLDNDCDGQTDEPGAFGCDLWLKDADHDGVGVAGQFMCLCEPAAPFTASVAGDCDDTSAAILPEAVEVCNGLDDDCDGQTDTWAGGSCWVDDAWGYMRSIQVSGNITGRILKDVQFPVDFTALTYDNTGLQLSLHFDEGEGAFIGDASGNENHATPLEQTAWEFGKELTAMTFDGQNDCIRVPTDPSLAASDAISVVLWFKWIGGAGRQALLSRSNECANEGAYNLYIDGGSLRFSYGHEGSVKTIWKLADSVPTSTWQHLAVTLRYSSGEVQAWLGGDPLVPTLLEGSPNGQRLVVDRDVFLGCRWMHQVGAGCSFIGAHDYFRGTLDEVRVYGRLLEPSEVIALLDRERGMYNVADVRFTQDFAVRSLPIAISEVGGVAMSNVQLRLSLSNPEVLARVTRDARDLRLYPAPTDKPYGETYTGLPFWVESVTTTEILLWVRVSLSGNTTKFLTLYYGNPQAKNVSSFDEVFAKDPDDLHETLIEYPFDEAGGQVAYDESGNGTNGTLANVSYVGSDGGQWGPHRDISFSGGNSLLFNGSNSHVLWNWPAKDFVLPTTNYAIELWFLPTSLDCGLFQMEDQENASVVGNSLFLSSGNVVFALDDDQMMQTTTPVVPMEWHHLLASVDPHNGARLFIDGVQAAAAPYTAAGFPPPKVKGHLGYALSSANRYFKGKIDAFRILTRGVGGEEAKARYHRSRWVFPPPQIDYGAPAIERMDVAQLSYWVESDRSVWVEVPFARPDEITDLRLYYGNINAYPQSSFSATFTKDADAPNDNGLLAEWHLDTRKGNWMFDDAAGHDGLLWNFTWGDRDGGGWASRADVEFQNGSYLTFNGETSYVEMPYANDLDPIDAFSVEFWVLWSGPKGNVDEQQFFQKGDAYGFAVGNGGLVQGHLLYHFLDPAVPTDWTSSGIVLSPGVWSHVALTWDGYNVKLFENGKLIRTEPFVGVPGLGFGDELLFGAGGTAAAPAAYFFGKLDEVRIYERTLHPLEVKAHAYRHQYVLPEPDLAVGSENAL